MANIGVDNAVCLVVQRQIVVAGADLAVAGDCAVVDERSAVPTTCDLVVAAVEFDDARAVEDNFAVDLQIGAAADSGSTKIVPSLWIVPSSASVVSDWTRT